VLAAGAMQRVGLDSRLPDGDRRVELLESQVAGREPHPRSLPLCEEPQHAMPRHRPLERHGPSFTAGTARGIAIRGIRALSCSVAPREEVPARLGRRSGAIALVPRGGFAAAAAAN
jgi:hypothetical protein